MTTPTAFITYSWDDEDHKAWVKGLAERLRGDGVNVLLDIWGVAPGGQLPEFMERAVTDSDFVLVICTPAYRERSDGRRGGVGYEGHIITSEIAARGNHEKFIPILRWGTWGDGGPTDAAAAWIKGKRYINLSGDPYSEEQYNELVQTLFGLREAPPPIGEPMVTGWENSAEWQEKALQSDARNLLEHAVSNDSDRIETFQSGTIRYILAGPTPFGAGGDNREFSRWNDALQWLWDNQLVNCVRADHTGSHFLVTEAGHEFLSNE